MGGEISNILDLRFQLNNEKRETKQQNFTVKQKDKLKNSKSKFFN